ncbi:hypothetical protein MUO79_08965 [Candidatus Bathyarchaeota archaeon]|nr:hypothetical protein [Candidatus Bathyarchaeota archaeon]
MKIFLKGRGDYLGSISNIQKGKKAFTSIFDKGLNLTENENLWDCINCKYIKCLNLFEKSKDSEDAGNELYVYSVIGKKIENKLDLSAHACANGRFLNASCFLTVPIFDDHKDSYLSDILIQVTRDFKASIYLAFSGHYRQAMQVLRCGFENLISGVYFESDRRTLLKKNAAKEEFSRLDGRFNEWKKQGRGDIHKSIEILRRVEFLSEVEEREWHELYRALSKFVHTPEEFVTRVTHAGETKLKGEFVCPAATYFNETQLIEWSDCYQKVFANLLKTVVVFHPEAFNTESGKLAVGIIEQRLKEYGHCIRVSEEIQKTLAQLKKHQLIRKCKNVK